MLLTGNRNAASLEALLQHLLRRVADPRHARQLAAVAHRLLDIYGGVVCCHSLVKNAFTSSTVVLSWLAALAHRLLDTYGGMVRLSQCFHLCWC